MPGQTSDCPPRTTEDAEEWGDDHLGEIIPGVDTHVCRVGTIFHWDMDGETETQNYPDVDAAKAAYRKEIDERLEFAAEARQVDGE